MLSTAQTIQGGTPSHIECPIRVKGGDLAPKGKGAFTVEMMSDGGVSLNVMLPSESGTPEPLDLMSLERVELVKTRSGLYMGKQWIIPTLATAAAFVAPPMIISTVAANNVVPLFVETASETIITAYGWLAYGGMVGLPYVAGVYSGSKLNRMARVVVVMNDGRYCVVEMPEAAFRFVQGIQAAANLRMEMPADTPDVGPEMADAAPAPA